MPNPGLHGNTYELVIIDKQEGRFKGFVILAHDADHELRHVELHASKAGSTIHGVLNTLEQAINIALEAHKGLDRLISAMEHQTFSPRGETNDPEIPIVTSIPHYVAERIKIDYRGAALVQSAPSL